MVILARLQALININYREENSSVLFLMNYYQFLNLKIKSFLAQLNKVLFYIKHILQDSDTLPTAISTSRPRCRIRSRKTKEIKIE
jgi:hypothetical protein